MHKWDLDTPALLVDYAVLERNVERMGRLARVAGKALRPHVKTHKTREIAELQMKHGASGITVAKVSEAEVMLSEGFSDILLANEIIGTTKADRVARLAAKARITVAVDSSLGIAQLAEATRCHGSELDVLIDLNTGGGRCGVPVEGDEAAVLADRISVTPRLRLAGLMTYEGHVYKATSREQVESIAAEVGELLLRQAEALAGSGYDVSVVSAGSTVSAQYLVRCPAASEIRPGTYVFNDVNEIRMGVAEIEDCALTVLATVISGPRDGRVVLDAGSKSLSSDRAVGGFRLGPPGGYGLVKSMSEATIVELNEEHAIVSLAAESREVRLGSKLELVPNHACTAVNLHDHMSVVDGEEVRGRWAVVARGKSQ